MKLENCTHRNIRISEYLDHWILYQRVLDRQTRDEFFESALIAYYRACAMEDDRIPEVPGLDSVAPLQATTQPTLRPGQADPGRAGGVVGQ